MTPVTSLTSEHLQGQYIQLNIYINLCIFNIMNICPTDLFAALSHDTRLRCMMLLMHHGELCVCEFTHALSAAQPHVSRNLALLREVGLVSDRREGLWIHYRINPALPEWVSRILDNAYLGLSENSPFSNDRAVLAAMPNRPGAPRCA